MKLLPLLLALSFCLTSPSWAQSEGGDLKSESESQQSPTNADDSMNSMWADTPEVKTETKKTGSKSKSKSKSKNRESKSSPTSNGASEVKSDSQPIQLEPAAKTGSDSQNTTVEKDTSLSTPIPLETNNTPAGGETTIIDVGGLCLSSVFQNSDLVRNSAWPGVGPFTGQNNQYADAQDNKLKMQVDGDHITALELLLNNQNGSKQSFLNLEMTCDFILEALGTKGSKIAEFNSYFEKNKDRISNSKINGENQVKTSAGAYVLGLANTGSNTILIQVSSKNGRVNADQSLASQTVTPAEEPTEIAATVPVAKPVKPALVAPAKVVKPVKLETKPETKPEVKPDIKPDKVEKTEQKDPLKDELAGAIRTWQTVKKSALKDRNPAGLSKILSGNLLQRQTDSIKALTESKHFYELTPKGVVVEKYTELSSSPAKYSVYAKVMELTKIMKDGATKPEKETDDTYSVNYTVERSGDHWTISNSLLLVKKK